MPRVFIAACVLLGSPLAEASDPRIDARADLAPERAAPGRAVVLRVTLDVPPGWHLWSMDPGKGPMALRLSVDAPAHVTVDGRWHGPRPLIAYDPGFKRDLARYEAGANIFELPLRIAESAPPGRELTVPVSMSGQICSAAQCLNQRAQLRAQLVIDGDAPAAEPNVGGVPLAVAEAPTRPAAGGPPPDVSGPERGATAAAAADWRSEAGFRDLGSFLLLAFLFGLGALVTPCVLPVVPLTVSFFSKYRERGAGRVVGLAATYAGTMVLFFTVAGIAVSVLFGVTGIQSFAAHPVFNLALAGLLVFFALNMLGLFEIQAPQFLLLAANRLEARFGRAAQREGGPSALVDYVTVAVAAVTATTVFFTCTVGFVGLVLVAAARGELLWPTLGMLAFSSAFALPFFVLALFPAWAQRLRGATGPWLSATRVTLGFLELAAAFKFLSNADLVWGWGVVTRDLVLAVWVPIFAVAGLYLLGKVRFVGESAADEQGRVTVLQSLFAIMLLALSTYLGVGMVQGRAFGGWIDGWLPPTSYPGAAVVAAKNDGLRWHETLADGRKAAADSGRLVFVNYTGYTCTNCRFMEEAIFVLPAVASQLRSMELVELYTDGGLAEHEAARADQVRRFGTAALPLYAVEHADGTVIATFASSTNDADEFAAFLADARARGGAAREASSAGSAAGDDWGAGATLFGEDPAPIVEHGRWTLVNFWATWCAPCREELSSFLVELGQSVEASGGAFRVVAMDEPEDLEEARSFVQELGLPEKQSLRLDPRAIPERWRTLAFDGQRLPFTALISPDGEVVWHQASATTRDELNAVLTQHM